MRSDTEPPIPMLDLTQEVDSLWPEISEAVNRVLRSGRYILGPEVEAFEREVAEYLGVAHAVGLNSGTDALVIGLRALGVGPGDEVITTAFSFFATAEAIATVGATPVFVDVDEDSFNIDPDRIGPVLTDRTKAIIPVHLFGRPAEMDRIMAVAREHGLKVLEDCAQSFGARYHGGRDAAVGASRALAHGPEAGGPEQSRTATSPVETRMTGSIGDASAFSFYPTKNLGTYGDGGMLATNDDEVARLARMLRNHGATPERRYENEMLGYNSRLDEVQAAILRVKLRYVDRWNTARRRVAERYDQLLGGSAELVVPAVCDGHVFHQYTVLLPEERRDAVRTRLQERGIASSVFYPVPLHRTLLGSDDADVPVSEMLAARVLSLPIWADMAHDRVDAVALSLHEELLSESS